MIRPFADTNWLVALFFAEQFEERYSIARNWLRRHEPLLLISPPVILECRNAFAWIAGKQNPEEWRMLQAGIGTRILAEPLSWERMEQKAAELSDRFSHKARIGTGDLLVIGSALLCGATHFLSFDTNSSARALAHVLKLSVFPEMTEKDKSLAAAIR